MTKHRKFTDEEVSTAVASSQCVYDVLRKLGVRLTGGSHSHFKRRFVKQGLSLTHFTGRAHNKGKPSPKRKSPDELLIKRANGRRPFASRLRRAMIEYGFLYECEICSIGPRWHGQELTLEIDHKNRDWTDDRPENLRFLCPNCHSIETKNSGRVVESHTQHA